MTAVPPLLPTETYVRVLRLARFDGMGVLAVAGLFAMLSALGGDRTGAIIGLLIAGAGAIELHGATLLQHGAPRGMNWLVLSQLYLLVTILAYCVFRLYNVDVNLWRMAIPEELKQQIKQSGQTVDEFILLANRLGCMALAFATAAYQGAMVVYYLRRRTVVTQALHNEE